jgi:hypothetical protein
MLIVSNPVNNLSIPVENVEDLEIERTSTLF